MLSDTCPKGRSCGGFNGLWSDDDMPKLVGFPERFNGYALDMDSGFCRGQTLEMEVVRCSWDNESDMVYRFLGPHVDTCTDSFCGME